MYTRILVPIDGSECSLLALEHAVALARVTGASITVLHALDPLKPTIPVGMHGQTVAAEQAVADLQRAAQETLDHAVERARSLGAEVEARLEEGGHPVDTIAEVLEEHDLAVMGTHGRSGFKRLLMGSITEGVIRRRAGAVLVVSQREQA